MALKRMDNVGIVVEDLDATIEFFRELGLELEGRAMVEGEWAGRVTGLGDQRVETAMNALGYLRVMFDVDDIDETLARLRKHGAELVSGEVVQYEDAYRLCYIRGPEGLLIGLAQELG
jgi:catechol 2,3-dioxygenase-like lactoylglutathione lyase family enzyme